MAPKSKSTSLKQGVLGFTSAKRTASTSNAKSKKPTQPALAKRSASADESLGRSDEEPINSYSEEYDGLPLPKKQRLKGGEVFGSKDGALNSAKAVAKSNVLDLQDKSGKWRKHYGLVRQRMGNIAPIHGENQSKVHEILRVFDLSYEYGPCVGVTRLERWERAEALGLKPPPEVHEILLTQQGIDQQELSQSVFYEEV